MPCASKVAKVVAAFLLTFRSLAAQCPDGSPPPCGRVVPRVPALNSVAVLYFDNLSSDTADALLADGLTEEIISCHQNFSCRSSAA